jgi:dephospho-CoA kinase
MNPARRAADERRSAELQDVPAPLVIGVTGGIGSGKSAVAAAFASLGIPVTDTDRLAHALCEPGAAGHRALREAWGSEVFHADGTLDRAALRRRVFANAAERMRLEALLHPLIAAAARAEIATWRGPYGLLVVPLLIERSGLRRLVNRILVVDCPEVEQVRRVAARSGLAAAEVQAIMATQVSRATRLAAADDVVDNSGPVDGLPPQVALLDRRYRALAGAAANEGRPA